MAADDVRADRRYTADHQWVKQEGDLVLVGITAFAVDQLGDISLVNVDVGVGDAVTAGAAFGKIESVKTQSDLFAPVSGTVKRVNAVLAASPEKVNEDCYGQGWMIGIEPSDRGELDALHSARGYTNLLRSAAH